MQAPGGLREFGAGATAAWEQLLTGLIRGAKPPRQVLPTSDARTPELTGVDWPAMPARIQSCLGRRRAHALLDWRTAKGDEGRRRHQEEYLEWRLVRSEDGKTRRIEMTTEFGDYWRILAGHQPQETLELIADFAGLQAVDPGDVYGELDPFAPGVEPARRSAAFTAMMLTGHDGAVVSRYNNGQAAICCMVQGSNTLGALIKLVAASAHPHTVIDAVTKQLRPMSGSEAIQVIEPGAAQDCRNSDPLVVERVVRLATEGRLMAFDDPIGVYIRGIDHHQLVGPDGADVPAEWTELSRGNAPSEASDDPPRFQRLLFEVPEGLGISLGDLRQRATGEPIAHGGQLAELVTLGVYMRTSPAGIVAVTPNPESVSAPSPCPDQRGCQEVRSSWQTFQQAGPAQVT